MQGEYYVMNNDYTLLEIINKFGTVPGKKALHKITYFTNLQTNDFLYRWNNYGPYSEEVQQFFDDSYLNDIIAVDPKPLKNTAIQYNTSLTKEGNVLLQQMKSENKTVKRIDSAIDFSYTLLHDKSPREMELLASVHYIADYDCTYDTERIWEIINKLKPESNFSKEEVEESLNILKKFKLISN